MKILYNIIFFSICSVCAMYGQTDLDATIDFDFNEVTYEAALNKLIDVTEISIIFSPDNLPPTKKFSLRSKGKTIRYFLDNFVKGVSLEYKLSDDIIIIYYNKIPQRSYRLSGYVEDVSSGERLYSANISIAGTTRGTSTNNYGFFSITLPGEEVEVVFSYLGYQTTQKKLNLKEDKFLDINLIPSITLTEVIVTPSLKKELTTTTIKESRISTTSLSAKTLNSLPTFVGESDLIRTTLLLPGVTSGADGIGGMHVRGGNADQNLILLDGVPIYNPFHTAGLFSVFNSNIVSSATLLTGAFPARYGGRISSVLDVRTKEGNNKKITGEIGIGTVSGKGTIEGPFLKGKGSFIVSGRRTFLDRIIENQSRKEKLRDTLDGKKPRIGFSDYNFYDLNVKTNYTFSKQDKLFLSYYAGSDTYHDEESQTSIDSLENIFLFESNDEDLTWGNQITSLRWNHLFNNKLFLNTTITYSNFYFKSDLLSIRNRETGGDGDFANTNIAQFSSDIRDWGGRLDFDYIHSHKHNLKFGAAYTHHFFKPGVTAISSEEIVEDSIPNLFDDSNLSNIIKASDFNIYVEDEVFITPRFKMNTGVHFTLFEVQRKKYLSVQPRVAAYYQLSPRISLKASFGQMRQHLHVLTNSGIGLPTDLWVPTTKRVAPQDSWQGVIGSDIKLNSNFNFKVEGYYKRMQNLIEYQEGATFIVGGSIVNSGLIGGSNWEDKVTTGEGEAYGVEMLLEKGAGKTQGWMSYNYSFSNRQYDGINDGEVYPYRYDRRHAFKVVLTHRFNHWIQAYANWLYSTGLSTTIPLSFYIYNPSSLPSQQAFVFSPKNSYRLPSYHRFDAGVNINLKQGKIMHIFNVGAYNIYNRRNPLYITLRERFIEEDPFFKREFVDVSIIPLVPSFSYTLKF